MCGIIGYIGNKQASNILVGGGGVNITSASKTYKTHNELNNSKNKP